MKSDNNRVIKKFVVFVYQFHLQKEKVQGFLTSIVQNYNVSTRNPIIFRIELFMEKMERIYGNHQKLLLFFIDDRLLGHPKNKGIHYAKIQAMDCS